MNFGRTEGREGPLLSSWRTKQGKAAGLPPQGKAQPRRKPAERKAPVRLNNARKLQRTLYRVAKQQPERRFTVLYDKVCRRRCCWSYNASCPGYKVEHRLSAAPACR